MTTAELQPGFLNRPGRDSNVKCGAHLLCKESTSSICSWTHVWWRFSTNPGSRRNRAEFHELVLGLASGALGCFVKGVGSRVPCPHPILPHHVLFASKYLSSEPIRLFQPRLSEDIFTFNLLTNNLCVCLHS
ncbi:unnamed protein product, partial [Ectocarpus sp. 6 AP-2014]